MKKLADTKTISYTRRLLTMAHKPWKTWLQVQKPYQWNLKRLQPGRTLDIGCGIGRYLKILSDDSVGIDHNIHSIRYAKRMGLTAYTTKHFKRSKEYKIASYDSLLLSHVLEHLHYMESVALINEFSVLLKPTGKLIIFCPQENGYASDASHITYMNDGLLQQIMADTGYTLIKSNSFPLPRLFGKYFRYNEFVYVGQKS